MKELTEKQQDILKSYFNSSWAALRIKIVHNQRDNEIELCHIDYDDAFNNVCFKYLYLDEVDIEHEVEPEIHVFNIDFDELMNAIEVIKAYRNLKKSNQ